MVDIFRRNIADHPRLRCNIGYIDYSLKMCGFSSTDASPAIVVFCRPTEFDDLRILLTSKKLAYQYSPKRPVRRHPWSGTRVPPTEDSHRPLFNLYPRTLYWSRVEVRVEPPIDAVETPTPDRTAISVCGSTVTVVDDEYSYRYGTLGLMIWICSEFASRCYAITSRHI